MPVPAVGKIPPAIFLSSAASLAYEVALTRIFSISLWYHYAFMIISIAMLGFAASGIALSLWPAMKDISWMGLHCLLLGFFIPASYLLANRLPFDPARLSQEGIQLLFLGLSCLVLAIPFFFAGLVIATAITVASERSGLFYGADLAGAGGGSLAVLLLMNAVAPERGVFLLSLLALVAACLISGMQIRLLALLLIFLNLILFVRPPPFSDLRISPYKGLEAALLFPGARHLKTYVSPFARVDTFTSPAVRFAPGLSLRYLEPLPSQIGIAVDAGEISAVTAAADPRPLAFLGYLPAALPYAVRSGDDALILDPRGGLQALVARYYGMKRIVKVETNPDLVRIIRKDLREFSGKIYEKETWCGLGRSWLSGRDDTFDVIDLSLLGTEPYGPFGIAEDYGFTVEAFKEYLGHLRHDGMLGISLYIIPPPRTEFRLLATIVMALQELGVREPADHVAAVRSWGTLCLLVKRTPLTRPEIEAIRAFSRERWFDPVYYPGIAEGNSGEYVKTAGTDYTGGFASIVDPTLRRQFLAGYPFDITPVRDDYPFPRYFLKWGQITSIYRASGGKWQVFLEEGGILPALLLQVMVLSACLLLTPAIAGTGRTLGKGAGRTLLPYFAFLGLGFMFVETAFIQKIILPLENPAYAVATLLAALLIGSGVGSLLSQHFPRLRTPWIALVIAILVAIYSLVLPLLLPLLAILVLPAKVILIFLLFLPVGLFMGIPFPTGLHLLGSLNPRLIPWALAANGCLSVIAPILALMLAMVAGYRSVLLAGAIAYLLACINLVSVKMHNDW